MDSHLVLLTLAVGFASFQLSTSQDSEFRCFTCVSSDPEPDDACLKNPASVIFGSPITPCTKKYCTITVRQYQDNKRIASILRDCTNVLNEVASDPFYRYTYYKCRTDLCNGGNGSQGGGGGSGIDGVVNIVVPDYVEPSAGRRSTASSTAVVLAVASTTMALRRFLSP